MKDKTLNEIYKEQEEKDHKEQKIVEEAMRQAYARYNDTPYGLHYKDGEING